VGNQEGREASPSVAVIDIQIDDRTGNP